MSLELCQGFLLLFNLLIDNVFVPHSLKIRDSKLIKDKVFDVWFAPVK